jgi:hypothetical protein
LPFKCNLQRYTASSASAASVNVPAVAAYYRFNDVAGVAAGTVKAGGPVHVDSP